jgi:hypothetical protein
VIHNAWQVNFNLALDSFEPQIRGVWNLLDFGAQSAHQAPLVFVSSVSTAHGWIDRAEPRQDGPRSYPR